MKKNHRFLALALVLCGINAGVNAQSFTYNGINYEVTSTSPKKVRVANNSSYSGAVVIPASVMYNSDTYAVTAIGGEAFDGCSGLTSVTIPESVERIGGYAFQNCSGLTSVTIPESVETIGEWAFADCSGLISVIIGNSVETIEANAFYLCSGLTSVTIPNSVKTIGDRAFTECHGLTSVTIPNSVTAIGNYAFALCIGLTGIDVAAGNLNYSSLDGVLFNKMQNTLIQYPAGKAGSYTIPNSVERIGEAAFIVCIGLTSVTIGNSVETIGWEAFHVCDNLTGIDVVAGNLHYSSLDGVLFNKAQNTLIQCPAGKAGSYTIPNSVERIGEAAFIYCRKLTSVTIANSVETIGKKAFAYCTGLTSVMIGNSVETIEASAFDDCSGLETIYVKAITPPLVTDYYTFFGVPTDIPVHVPCGRAAAYRSAAEWSVFTNYIEDLPLLNLTVQSEDANKGTASITQANTCDNNTAVIAATPLTGYQFKQWSDGNTANPRTLTLTQDMVLTAIFESISGIDGTQATALALYPNPVRDELFISGISGEAKIVITDLSGRTVGTWRTTSLQSGETSINVSHLAKGVYLVRIGNVTGKIVKE